MVPFAATSRRKGGPKPFLIQRERSPLPPVNKTAVQPSMRLSSLMKGAMAAVNNSKVDNDDCPVKFRSSSHPKQNSSSVIVQQHGLLLPVRTTSALANGTACLARDGNQPSISLWRTEPSNNNGTEEKVMENSLQVLRLREHSTPLSLSFGDQVSVATSGSSHSSYDDIIPDESNDFILFTDNTNSEYEDYEDSWESSVIQFALSQLSEEEKEMAARSSFQYEQQVVSTTARTATETDSTMEEMTAVERYTRIQRRDQAASDMVRRHLFASGGHIGEAVRSCRATLQFREEHQVSTRSKIWLESKRHVSHDPDGNDDDYCWMEHKCAAAESKSSILRLQGFDKRGRLNPLVKPSAASSSRKFARVDSLDASICMLEKAVALTEIKSCELPVGRSSLSDSQVSNESVVVTVNFDDFVPWRVQFLAVTNDLLFLLRHHYPGRTWRVYLIDAPLVVRFLCSIVTLLFWVDTFGSAVEFVNVMRHKSLVSSYSDGLSEEGYIHENSSFLTPSKIPMNNFSLLPRIDTFSDEDDPLDGSSIVSSDTDTPTKGPSNDFQRKVIGGGKIAVPLLVHAERRQHSCSELKFDPNVCMSERIEI